MKMIHGKAVFDRLEELLHPKHCALLVVDMRNDFCAPGGHYARHGKNMSAVYCRVPVPHTSVDAARHHSVFVAFVQTATLPNGTSDSPAWLSLKTRDGKSPDTAAPREPNCFTKLTLGGLVVGHAGDALFSERAFTPIIGGQPIDLLCLPMSGTFERAVLGAVLMMRALRPR